jgi:hypothetical protein
MAATIKIKNSSTASAVPTSSDLVQGELAVNVTDKRVFTENASGTVVELGTNPSTLTVAADATINGIKVGQGAGSVSSNTAVGASALNSNTTGLQNTAFGQLALRDTVGGTENTAVGRGAAYQNTSGSKNAVLGTLALQGNTTGSNNTAVGMQALQANSTASKSTAVGFSALYSNTGNYNSAFGSESLYSNTTGTLNTGLGRDSLFDNTTGSYNTAVGQSALENNTTASYNTAVGYQAGYSNSTSAYNVFVGYVAGYTSTGGYNTYIGNGAGYLATTATYNSFLGYGAGQAITTGSKNSIIGAYTGNQGGLDIRTASNYIVLSDGDGNPRIWNDGGAGGRPWFNYGGTSRAVFNNTSSGAAVGIYVWYNAATPNNTASEFLYCDDASATRATIRSNGGIANYSGNNVNLSDRREKTNFAPAKSYLDVICAIPVQTFNYIDQNLEEDDGLTLGVVAQDVQAVAPELVMESNWAKEGDEPRMRLSIYQTDLQYALMKALQELKAEFDAYKEAHP